MQIGGISSTINNSLKYNNDILKNNSGDSTSPLEKQKQQIQDQISKIEQSKLSDKEKNDAINKLKTKLEEIDKQILQEKTTDSKKVDENSNSNNNEQENEEENTQAISKDVMRGMVSASTHQKTAKTCYSVYVDKKDHGDEVAAEKALSYASSELEETAKSRKLIDKGIKEYRKQLENSNKDDRAKGTSEDGNKENGADIDSDVKINIQNDDAQDKPKGTTKEKQDNKGDFDENAI
ncbi:hypothetical protein [Clostridium oryzae]|uniref:Uncharacterized protein n=1 Tax=Clostridium oryzae TaxID=1450648 RepID=A0A1V4ISR7_9CLOT|nr:hypothetical protein [Clostridium oryzae]OPJ62939.1 hypothetical protein CLORY_15630 [Clostridium oryzae]